MNKKTLNTYLKTNKRDLLEKCCFKYDNSYLISDSYSIISLNNRNDLKLSNDILGLSRMYQNFINNYEFESDYIPLYKKEEKIDDSYYINMKLFRRIKAIIKADKFKILKIKENYSYSAKYIIKLENTKTKENAFLLPMKGF